MEVRGKGDVKEMKGDEGRGRVGESRGKVGGNNKSRERKEGSLGGRMVGVSGRLGVAMKGRMIDTDNRMIRG